MAIVIKREVKEVKITATRNGKSITIQPIISRNSNSLNGGTL